MFETLCQRFLHPVKSHHFNFYVSKRFSQESKTPFPLDVFLRPCFWQNDDNKCTQIERPEKRVKRAQVVLYRRQKSQSSGPALRPELSPGPRSLTSSIALVPQGLLRLLAAGYRISSSCQAKSLWVLTGPPFLSSFGFTPAPLCLESICPQHCLDKSSVCVPCDSSVLQKGNVAIKGDQEFLPDAASSIQSQQYIVSIFILSYGHKSFSSFPMLP